MTGMAIVLGLLALVWVASWLPGKIRHEAALYERACDFAYSLSGGTEAKGQPVIEWDLCMGSTGRAQRNPAVPTGI